MQPTLAKHDGLSAFEELGRASVHIVHDLKNQLNGLKLYATFLRKRLDRDDRPQDERETVAKLMAGLDRTANDLNAIVRYAQPPELKSQEDVDLINLISKAFDEAVDDASFGKIARATIDAGKAHPLYGNFDSANLIGAIKIFAKQAMIANRKNPLSTFKIARDTKSGEALIEWRNNNAAEKDDPFRLPEGIALVRIAFATRVVEAHGGRVEHDPAGLRIWLPLTE